MSKENNEDAAREARGFRSAQSSAMTHAKIAKEFFMAAAVANCPSQLREVEAISETRLMG